MPENTAQFESIDDYVHNLASNRRWEEVSQSIDLQLISPALSQELLNAYRADLIDHHVMEANASYELGQWSRVVYHSNRCQSLSDQTIELKGFHAAKERLNELASEIKSSGSRTVYITGCGRSGTWLLASMFGCFANTFSNVDAELDFDKFAPVIPERPEQCIVLKRNHDAYMRFDLMPHEISQVHIVRNPCDVLTSRQFKSERHIKPLRWCAETMAFNRIMERKNLTIVRYEDLVSNPDRVQSRLAKLLDLKPDRHFSKFYQGAIPASLVIRESMKGIRPPDRDSVGKWKHNSNDHEYIRSVWPLVSELAESFCEKFSYEKPDVAAAQIEPAAIINEEKDMSDSQTSSNEEAPSNITEPTMSYGLKDLNGRTKVEITVEGLSESQAWEFLRRMRLALDFAKKLE